MVKMDVEKKLAHANEIVKKYVAANFDVKSWRYIDFVNEDRFLYEIKTDGFDLQNHKSVEIAEYAIEQLT